VFSPVTPQDQGALSEIGNSGCFRFPGAWIPRGRLYKGLWICLVSYILICWPQQTRLFSSYTAARKFLTWHEVRRWTGGSLSATYWSPGFVYRTPRPPLAIHSQPGGFVPSRDPSFSGTGRFIEPDGRLRISIISTTFSCILSAVCGSSAPVLIFDWSKLQLPGTLLSSSHAECRNHRLLL